MFVTYCVYIYKLQNKKALLEAETAFATGAITPSHGSKWASASSSSDEVKLERKTSR